MVMEDQDLLEFLENNYMLKEIVLSVKKWDWKLWVSLEYWEIVSFNWELCKWLKLKFEWFNNLK